MSKVMAPLIAGDGGSNLGSPAAIFAEGNINDVISLL